MYRHSFADRRPLTGIQKKIYKNILDHGFKTRRKQVRKLHCLIDGF